MATAATFEALLVAKVAKLQVELLQAYRELSASPAEPPCQNADPADARKLPEGIEDSINDDDGNRNDREEIGPHSELDPGVQAVNSSPSQSLFTKAGTPTLACDINTFGSLRQELRSQDRDSLTSCASGVEIALHTARTEADPAFRFGLLCAMLLESESGTHKSVLLQAWTLHDAWLTTSTLCTRLRLNTCKFNCSGKLDASDQTSEVLEDYALRDTGALRWIVLHPCSARRLLWTGIGCMNSSWDLVTLPMQVFDVTGGVFMSAMDMAGTIYWSLDLILQFFCGYLDGESNVVEMRLAKISKHYLRTWFLLDLPLVLVDLSLLLLESYLVDAGRVTSSYEANKVVRASRFLRVVRMMRLARLSKLYAVFEFICDCMKGQRAGVLLRLLFLLLQILALNHFVACMWYGVGRLSVYIHGIDDASWIQKYHLQEQTVWRRYILALHWSLTQYTPATNDIAPRSSEERCFAVFVVLFALCGFSSFVSSITGAVSELRSVKHTQNKQERDMRKFLDRTHISAALRARIMRFVRKHYEHRKPPVLESSVPIVREMPDCLKSPLHLEMFSRYFRKHNVMSYFMPPSCLLHTKVCHLATSESLVLPQRDVFCTGTKAQRLRFLVHGSAGYVMEDELDSQQTVRRGSWISDIALWAKWRHAGTLTAEQSCEFVEVDIHRFRALLAETDVDRFHCFRFYAILKVTQSEDMGSGRADDLSYSDDVLADKLLWTARKFANVMRLKTSVWREASLEFRTSASDLKRGPRRGSCKSMQRVMPG